MLVLTRRPDESIMIGEDIEIMVVSIQGNKVRLGIRAPSRVPVFRKEIYLVVREQNRQAALIPSDIMQKLIDARSLFKKPGQR